MDTTVRWTRDMEFEATVDSHTVIMDGPEAFGGHDRGPGPKSLVLVGMAGCTGMDVISILGKMRVFPEQFSIGVTVETGRDHPRVFTKVHITFRLTGRNLSLDKVERAVTLSQDKYCAVTAMVRKSAEITYEIVLSESGKNTGT